MPSAVFNNSPDNLQVNNYPNYILKKNKTPSYFGVLSPLIRTLARQIDENQCPYPYAHITNVASKNEVTYV